MSAELKFTIITVVFNGEKYIRETIESVINQTYQNIEYIVVDGKSTDNTLAIINEYPSKISKIVSEKDEGMYFAINKGIEFASGDYILVLNSDDYLVNNNVISTISGLISSKKNDFFWCNILRKKENKYRKIKLKKIGFKQLLLSTHCTFVPHPSFFISKDFIKENNLSYSTNYRYAADYDYILKALKLSNNFEHLNIFSTVFREHPESITSSGKIDKERLEILDAWNYKNYSFLDRKIHYFANWFKYKLKNFK